MRFFAPLLGLLALLSVALATDNGLQKVVTWDPHSLMINGERIFIMGGEFHYQRLPVPELWLDVFQKFKANGMNAVSIYFFWSYHSPSQGVYDFTAPPKDIQLLIDMAKQAGLYVIARPGPYCNAETSAGGFALWTTDGSGGSYRTSDEKYRKAWSEWIKEVGAIIAKNQITNGGPVIMAQIENELQETKYDPNDTLVKYMEQLKKAFRDAGIVVPLSHNEKGMRSKSWSTDYNNVGGAVDLYGLDSYPGGMSCTNPDSGFNLPRTYYQWFQEVAPSQPQYMPEFEAGWFQPWGGAIYDACKAEHSPEFADVYYKGMIGQRVSLLNLYMGFGGTNWGHSAAPVVYTSYDYSSTLSENRQVTDKFRHFKLLALWTRVSKGLHKTIMESNGTGNAVSSSSIWTWVLKNPDTSARFYLAENNKSSSRSVTDFTITVNTSAGKITIPTLQLSGRQSRFVVTDHPIGNETFLYSSAEILTYGTFDRPVVVFYLREGQAGEFAFKSAPADLNLTTYGSATDLKGTLSHGITKYTYKQTKGTTVVEFSNGVLAYLLDISSAYSFHAPPTTSNPNITPDKQIFVFGPQLVRSVSINGSTVSIIGDNANTTKIEVYTGNPSITTISWNGESIPTYRTPYGALTNAAITGVENLQFTLPSLSSLVWKTADSLPELSPTYDDSHWIVANKTTTQSPVKPLTLPVLFSSDYAFYAGAKLYRATFSSRSAATLNITVQGGSAAGWTSFINGKFLGGHPGDPSKDSTNAVLKIDATTHALKDKDNVLLVITDYTGHDQTSTGPAGGENPRGILGATLKDSPGKTIAFDKWKIAGNAGADKNIDSVRGPMNEGGLYGERLGWHLPGFDTSAWSTGSPLTGFSGAGIRWYSTSFSLNLPDSYDVPMGIELGSEKGVQVRVLVYVNGWQFGKYVGHLGPQTKFPVPPGILNMKGKNEIGLVVWAQEETGAKLTTVRLVEFGRFASGYDFGGIDGKRLQTGWKDRSAYA